MYWQICNCFNVNEFIYNGMIAEGNIWQFKHKTNLLIYCWHQTTLCYASTKEASETEIQKLEIGTVLQVSLYVIR